MEYSYINTKSRPNSHLNTKNNTIHYLFFFERFTFLKMFPNCICTYVEIVRRVLKLMFFISFCSLSVFYFTADHFLACLNIQLNFNSSWYICAVWYFLPLIGYLIYIIGRMLNIQYLFFGFSLLCI